MSNFHTIRTSDVAEVVSGHLQQAFARERHAVKRLAGVLQCGLSKAEKLLRGDMAPTSADLINLLREFDDDFAESILRALTGKALGPTDRGRALQLAQLLQSRADELRQLAGDEATQHDRSNFRGHKRT